MSKLNKPAHHLSRNGYQKRGKPSSEDRTATRHKKCYHHLKLLQKALKKAKQFELSKLKRRAKAAEGTPETNKLAVQLATLVELDLDAAARQVAIRHGIASDAIVVTSSPTVATGSAAGDPDATACSSAADVLLARLLSAKAVRDIVTAAQKALSALDAAAAAADVRQKELQARDEKRQQQRQQRKSHVPEGNTIREPPIDSDATSGSAERPSDSPRKRAMDDFGNPDDESSTSGSDDGSTEGIGSELKRRRLLLLDSHQTQTASNGDVSRDPKATPSNVKPRPAKKPKNRLGQRARRLHAEREFGSNAKHLPVRQAAVPLKSHGHPSSEGPGGAATTEAAVHPSWAAKAQAKLQSAAKATGTKMLFDDDGEVAAVEPLLPSRSAAQAPLSKSCLRESRPSSAARPWPVRTASAAMGGATASPTSMPLPPPPPPRRREVRVPGVPRATLTIPARRMALAKSHPSWEAKAKLRAQMSALPKPQGTKTVFTD